MQTYKSAAKVDAGGNLLLHVPFRPGEQVEVTVRRREQARQDNPYPLRGLPYSYERPTDPVAGDDWDVLE